MHVLPYFFSKSNLRSLHTIATCKSIFFLCNGKASSCWLINDFLPSLSCDTIQQRTPVMKSHFRNVYSGMQKPLYLQLQRNKAEIMDEGRGKLNQICIILCPVQKMNEIRMGTAMLNMKFKVWC